MKTFLIIIYSLFQLNFYSLNENFGSLEMWKDLTFPKIKRHSTYQITEDKTLKAETNNSASGIIYKESFNVYDKQNLEFKWRAENVFEKGDSSKKSGDDYPIRVYVIFEYNEKKASFSKKLKYKAAKTLYGEYPPDSTLNYIWSNKEKMIGSIVSSPYAEEAKLITLQAGKSKLKSWHIEKRNIISDYKKAFGKEPPKIASIAIMSDSDNTKESATSYVDWIKVY